jgi:peptidyl-prolyl cis-trans isomerase D
MASNTSVQKTLGSSLIIAAIATIFVLQFGPGAGNACEAPTLKGPADVAATVNGRNITAQELKEAIAQQKLPPELVRQFSKRVLETLVEKELLEQAAENQGIVAPDEEVREIITKNPNFQVDGAFDNTQYVNMVRDGYRQTTGQFEDTVRRELSAQKLIAQVESSAYVSDDEVKAHYQKSGNQAALTVVRFVPSLFADKAPKPPAAEVAAYVKAHEAEIAQTYAKNRAAYHTDEKVQARHILVKVDHAASDADKKAALAKVTELRRRIVDGKEDFAAVAKVSSEDTGTKAAGGDLGLVERNSLLPEVAKAAFALPLGQVSEPVLSAQGYHLVQVLSKKPAEDRTLEQVKDEIAESILRRDGAKKLARAAADEALAALKKGKSLKTQFPPPGEDDEDLTSRFAVPNKPQAKDTGDFPAVGDSIPYVGTAPALAKDVAASKAPAPLEHVYETPEAFVLAELTSRTHPSEAGFEKDKDKLKQQAIDARKMEIVRSYVDALRRQATITTNDAVTGQRLNAS